LARRKIAYKQYVDGASCGDSLANCAIGATEQEVVDKDLTTF